MENDTITFTKEFISALTDLLDEVYDQMCVYDCGSCDFPNCAISDTRIRFNYARQLLRLAI